MRSEGLGRFLADVHASVVELGLSDLARVQLIFGASRSWPREERRAAMSSLLARNEREWKDIAARFDRYVEDEPADSPDASATRPPIARRPPGEERLRRRRILARLWLVLVGLALVGGVVVAMVFLWPSSPAP